MCVAFYEGQVTIQKVGQFPQTTLLAERKSVLYKSVLRRINDSFIDYSNAEKSKANGLVVGAYDYLRRVFENMINYYLKKNNIILSDNPRAKEKIKAVEFEFNSKIRKFLAPLYGALSIGIHELSEEECQKHYEQLKAIIDIQLEYIKENDDMEKQLSESSKALNELNALYGNNEKE